MWVVNLVVDNKYVYTVVGWHQACSLYQRWIKTTINLSGCYFFPFKNMCI